MHLLSTPLLSLSLGSSVGRRRTIHRCCRRIVSVFATSTVILVLEGKTQRDEVADAFRLHVVLRLLE